ncbi:MAG: tol-pal system-associated acyl-CoA thioesterase [Mangrovicoccus sp.]|nr:tol-pal system-associated acyl-CoA thioesterase [Mangrovicoccus sp.]
MSHPAPHRFGLRVYYEDTDLAGIVYYANYLRYIERARSEFVRSLGLDQVQLKAQTGVVFAVRRVEADYLMPARFDDELVVTTAPVKLGGARLVMRQEVLRGTDLCFAALVTIAALQEDGRPARLPAQFRADIAALI